MEITKYFSRNKFVNKGRIKKVSIQTDSYVLSVADILSLSQDAKKDFPNLTFEEIEIHKFYHNTLGIQFETKGRIPKEYIDVNNLP